MTGRLTKAQRKKLSPLSMIDIRLLTDDQILGLHDLLHEEMEHRHGIKDIPPSPTRSANREGRHYDSQGYCDSPGRGY